MPKGFVPTKKFRIFGGDVQTQMDRSQPDPKAVERIRYRFEILYETNNSIPQSTKDDLRKKIDSLIKKARL